MWFLLAKIAFALLTIFTLALMVIGVHLAAKWVNKKTDSLKDALIENQPVNKYDLRPYVFEKLVKLGAYEKWEVNFEKHNPIHKRKNILSGISKNIGILIGESFFWADTPEGTEYWHKISQS